MAADTQKRKLENRDTHRVVVRVPLNVSYLLTLIANYQLRTKASLADEVWCAGLQQLLGLNEKDLETLLARPLPRGTQPPEDVSLLVNALLRDA
jgi:hypothetical protein